MTLNGNKLEFNSSNIYRWFRFQGRKEKSAQEKPMLTPEMKVEQKRWCEDTKKLIAEP